MTVVSIPMTAPGSTEEIQSWITDHPTTNIQRILAVGSFWYIFYE